MAVQSFTFQRMQALGHANQVRMGRAAVKQDLAAGTLSIFAVLERPPACVRSMLVLDLLAAQRYWGPYRARLAMVRAKVSTARRVEELTAARRFRLVGELTSMIGDGS